MVAASHAQGVAEDDMKRALKRLKQLRDYRATLLAECNERVNKFLATPDEQLTVADCDKQNDYMRRVQLRMRLTNVEIDRIIDRDPRVLLAAA
jgi:glutamyl-tRNA reductase